MARDRSRFEVPGMEERLNKAFAKARVNKSELARRCDLESWQVGRILSGVLPESFERLTRVADELSVPWQWLLIGDEGEAVLSAYRDGRWKPPAKSAEQIRRRG